MISVLYSKNRHSFTFESLKQKTVRDVLEQVVEQDKLRNAVLTCEGKPIDASTSMESLFDESSVFLVVLQNKGPERLSKAIDSKALEEARKMVNSYARLYDKRLLSETVQEIIANDFIGILLKTYPEILHDPSSINVFRDSRILLTLLFEEPDKFEKKIPLFFGFKTLLTLMKAPLNKRLNPLNFYSNLAQLSGDDQEPPLVRPLSREAPEAVVFDESSNVELRAPTLNAPSAPSTSANTGNPVTREMLNEAIAFAMSSINSNDQNPVRNHLFNAGHDYDSNMRDDDEDDEETERNDRREDYSVVFRAQLEKLVEFGFTDEEENIRALIAAGGDLDHALNIIISARE